MCVARYIHCIHVHVYYFSGGGGQTNISRNRGGRRLQLKCIKFKLAKIRGGGRLGNVAPQPP